MELTLHFRFHTSTTPPSNYFCHIPSFCQVQGVSSSSTKCTLQKNSVITMQYSPNKHKKIVIPVTKDSKTEKRNKARVLSDAQTSEDGMILSLNEKPDRPVRTRENDDSGENYGDLSFGPNHRSGFVAVIGKPNVGKSTLLNQMIGQKLSIVTDKPQTTRHRILGLCSAPDYQIVLYDTPGVMEKKTHKLDDMMMKNVHTATIDTDCLLIVVDACRVPEKINDLLEGNGSDIKEKPPTLLVLNKKDLIKPGEITKKVEWYTKSGGVDHILPVSAKYGHGVDDVKNWIVSKLPHGPTYYPKDIISEHPERFFVAEIVREKIFMQYRKEIPYACQVNVINYIARPKSKHFIEVEILVEKETQKMILLGKDGRAIKILATAARLDIEDFLQKEVYLEMKVKVKPNWREDEDFLKRVGYGGEIRVL